MKYLWLIWAICCTTAFAQTKMPIEGQVADAQTGSPVAFATVVAQSAATKKVLAFANTDDDGRYKLAVMPDSAGYIVTVRFIGYAKQEKNLPYSADMHLDFSLVPENMTLNEVIVEAKQLRISFMGDTTAYKVEAFLDGSEQSIEDLLKKLPGISVADDGAISYKGKQVSAVMIDGDNLLGNNYTLATRSARADLLSEVHAIENYNENPLLKSIEGGTGTVLDLRVREDRKKVAFGNLDFHYGLENARKMQANVFSYLKKTKIYAHAGHNNIGKDSAPDTFESYSGSVEEILERLSEPNLTESQPLLSANITSTPPISGRRSNFNKEAVGGLNIATPLSERTKITLHAMGVSDRNARGFQDETKYLLDQPIIFSTEQHFTSKPMRWQTDAELQRKGKSSFLIYKLDANTKQLEWAGSTRFSDDRGVETIKERLSERHSYALQTLEYTKKISENKAIVARLKHGWIQRPQLYTVLSDSARFSKPFGLPSGYTQASQQADYQRQAGTFQLRMPIKVKNLLYQTKVGGEWWHEKIGSAATVSIPQEDATHPLSNFQGHSQFGRMRFYAGGNASYQTKRYKASVRLYANYARQSIMAIQDTGWTYVNPDVSLAFYIGQWKSIGIGYSHDRGFQEVYNLYSVNILSNFRTISQGLAHIVPSGEGRTSLSFNHHHKKKEERYSLSIAYLQYTNAYRVQVSAASQMQALGVFVQDFADGWRYAGEYNRFFADAGLHISANASTTIRKQEGFVNETPRNNTFYNTMVSLGFGLVTGKALSLGGNIKVYNNDLVSEFAGKRTLSHNRYADGTMNLQVKHKKGTLKVGGEWIRLEKRTWAFADILLTIPISKRITFYATCNNLMNASTYKQRYLTDFANYTNSFLLIPRRILIGANMNF